MAKSGRPTTSNALQLRATTPSSIMGKTGMGGSRKKDACNQIADMINNTGMRKICMGKQVQSKIEHLEKSIQKTYEFSFTETDQGLMGSWNRARVPSVKPS